VCLCLEEEEERRKRRGKRRERKERRRREEEEGMGGTQHPSALALLKPAAMSRFTPETWVGPTSITADLNFHSNCGGCQSFGFLLQF
jgi:hypothetical protein